MSIDKRINNKTVKTQTCWLWTGAQRGNGYGAIKIAGKTKSVHRVVYEIAYKQIIPQGLMICHTCDVRNCIKPEHLFCGTHSDNMADCLKKGRRKVPNGKKFLAGELHINHKLTNLDVKNIKLLREEKKSLRFIAERYKIDHSRVWQITKNQSPKIAV